MADAFNRKVVHENHRHMARRENAAGLSVDELIISKKKSVKSKKKGKSQSKDVLPTRINLIQDTHTQPEPWVLDAIDKIGRKQQEEEKEKKRKRNNMGENKAIAKMMK